MTSTPVSRPDWRRRWWLWPLLPFAFLGAVIGFLFILIMAAVIAPIAKVSSWRRWRRAKKKLVEEGRYIDLSDAKARYVQGGYLFLVEFTKNDKNVWLIPLSPTDCEDFAALPTYREFEADPRSVVGKLFRMDQIAMSKLVPGLRRAVRVRASLDQLVDNSIELKESIRVLQILQLESPSALLYESCAKTS
jgi:hypothetical protein